MAEFYRAYNVLLGLNQAHLNKACMLSSTNKNTTTTAYLAHQLV